MKYTFHIVDVFSLTPFGGVQLAVLPDAAGISTEGMKKIAHEFLYRKRRNRGAAVRAGVSDRRGRSYACKPAAIRDQEVEVFNAEPYAHHWFGKNSWSSII